MREGPSQSYPKITSVTAGAALEVLGKGYTSARWVQIQLSGRTGWVYADFTDLQPDVYDALPSQGWYPPTGIIQGPENLQGRRALTVKNQGSRDQVVVLAKNDQPVVVVYVRASDQTTVTGIPLGTYTVFYTTGRDWNGREFLADARPARADAPLVYDEDTGGWTLTFNVTNGNASSSPVSASDIPPITTASEGE